MKPSYLKTGPFTLKAHGVFKGKKLTSYPRYKEPIMKDNEYTYSEETTVVDGKMFYFQNGCKTEKKNERTRPINNTVLGIAPKRQVFRRNILVFYHCDTFRPSRPNSPILQKRSEHFLNVSFVIKRMFASALRQKILLATEHVVNNK